MRSLILKEATRLLVGLMLMVSIFLLLRGHNAPGGGFAGGLVGATALVLLSITHGPETMRRVLVTNPRNLAVVGLTAALISGLPGLLLEGAFLKGMWMKLSLFGETLTLSTPFLFDTGVYLAVLGTVTTLVSALEED